ncbi:hypothetical protein [Lentzea sp. NPDC004782]|uniref:hypothetical protein n=1 Tax=Lentzea sp. NPDC004782 TaxID=3154458 RepID=UPI0033B37041
MPEVMSSGAGLTDRAVAFLRERADVLDDEWDADKDRETAEKYAENLGISALDILDGLRRMRERFGGLRWPSTSWSFEEVLSLVPVLRFDQEVRVPEVYFVDHMVAHPFTVHANFDGEVVFVFDSSGLPPVTVFDRCESLIESDALYWECGSWREVASGTDELVEEIDARAKSLTLVEEASGRTEQWWEGDGFRVLVWRTYAELFHLPDMARWGVWARDEQGERNARAVLGLPADATWTLPPVEIDDM